MTDMSNLFAIKRCLEEALAAVKVQIEKEESSQNKPIPLTKQELMDLMEDETWISDGKNIGWVQPVGFNFVIPALLDVWEREIVAVTSAMRDGSDWYWIRDYGKTWVAYLDKPVFDNE